ncbi:hypothetical protein D9M71_752250 [compost metagenome]
MLGPLHDACCAAFTALTDGVALGGQVAVDERFKLPLLSFRDAQQADDGRRFVGVDRRQHPPVVLDLFPAIVGFDAGLQAAQQRTVAQPFRVFGDLGLQGAHFAAKVLRVDQAA